MKRFIASIELVVVAFFATACGVSNTIAQAIQWEERTVTGRYGAAMVFDLLRGELVMTGGAAAINDSPSNETFTWNGHAWNRRTGAPNPRLFSSCAFDAARGVTVVFGGSDNDLNSYNQTWEWNGTGWTQRNVSGPVSRYGAAMAYDLNRHVCVLFGGYAGVDAWSAQTWEWNGTAWRQVMVAGPTARFFHTMTFDAARGKIVLFGGESTHNITIVNGETWAFDGALWTQLNVTGPAARCAHAAAYDASRQRVVLYGGQRSQPFGQYDDTWEWNGSSWSQVLASGPSGRDYHSMCTSADGAVLLFGGRDSGLAASSELWELRNGAWQLLQGQSPGGRGSTGLATDSQGRGIVLFGGVPGYEANPGPPRGDTWNWDGNVWSRRDVIGPAARGFHAMSSDTQQALALVFGGSDWSDESHPLFFADTWRWNGNSWMQLNVSGPSARDGAAMSLDSTRRRVVLFGGRTVDLGFSQETWEWDGTSWILASNVGPSPRFRHAMAYDSLRRVTVLYGGSVWDGQGYLANDELWEWDGSSWTLRLASGGPDLFVAASLVYDPVRHVMINCGGGYNRTTGRTVQWEWDGTTWHTSQSSARMMSSPAAVAYDPVRRRVIRFSGSARNDLWEMKLDCSGCRADLNCDLVVDLFDYLDFVEEFSTGSVLADFNGDGATDIFDYLDFAQVFTNGC